METKCGEGMVDEVYDATKVRTYQPVIALVGKGPICEDAQYAVRDIIEDIFEEADAPQELFNKVDEIALPFARLIEKWVDGEYDFLGHKVIIKRYARGYLDELPEFTGY